MRHKYTNQLEEKDCAATCLYNIIKYYKGNISIEKLTKMLNTDKLGTSVFNIVQTSKQIGFISNAYKCELNDLCSLKLPVIAHIKVDKKYEHYVIIDKIVDDILIIHDPIRGYIKYDMNKFSDEWTNIVITFDKTDNVVNEKDDSVLFKFLSYLKTNYKFITLILLLSIIISLFSIFHSFYLSYLYDNYLKAFNIFIIFILISILNIIISYIRNSIVLKYNKKIDFSLTNKVYNKILSLPLRYHHNRPVGDIISRINDLSSIKEFINVISFSFIIDLIYVLIIGIILFVINKLMFLLLFIISSIYILIYLIFRSSINKYSLINKENGSSVNTYMVESILGIDTIKNLNITKSVLNMFRRKYNKFLNSNIKISKLVLNFGLIQDFVCTFSSILMIFLGINFLKNNTLDISSLIIVNTLIIYYFSSLKNIISIDNLIIESKNSYKRIKLLYNETKDDTKKGNFKFKNLIQFKNLNYAYNENNVLNNINFEIKKNDFVFVKGKSGAGKSTIFKMLTKQLETKRNMIKIDNKDINKISLKDINDNICYVSQNEFIFTDSILNNIKLFKEAKKEELDKVLRITNIDEILKERKISLDFLLEENGHNLSGGERQKILLARSLLRNKKILILDETMNEIDSFSERKIIEKIKAEYNITFILISHRDDNSDLFDKVISI
ncbi:MAG: ATP-binding cassette domain-containing protein [Bacilli bacterium]|nr:ATP-binding cassette domain-containing protein [Bacilli bacterium]